jgi:hypothetical protein
LCEAPKPQEPGVKIWWPEKLVPSKLGFRSAGTQKRERNFVRHLAKKLQNSAGLSRNHPDCIEKSQKEGAPPQ